MNHEQTPHDPEHAELFQAVENGFQTSEDTKTRMAVLHESYVKGEVDPEDYSEQMQMLEYKLSQEESESTPKPRSQSRMRQIGQRILGR